MVSEYEHMEQLAYNNNIMLFTGNIPGDLSGYFYKNIEYGIKTITLNINLDTIAERTCILAEEIEHYLSTPNDLFEAPLCLQSKYERIARFNAAKRLIPFEKLIRARSAAVRNEDELADYLNVTSDFLLTSLNLYKDYYGLSVTYKGYIIYFDPLSIEKQAE